MSIGRLNRFLDAMEKVDWDKLATLANKLSEIDVDKLLPLVRKLEQIEPEQLDDLIQIADKLAVISEELDTEEVKKLIKQAKGLMGSMEL